MAELKILSPGLAKVIPSAGGAVLVANTTMGDFGGVIVNPRDAVDQGLTSPESLWISLIGTPTVGHASGTTDELVPGQWYLVPPNSNVWVGAVSAGHMFTSWFSKIYAPPYPPTPVPGTPGAPGQPGTGAAIGAEAGAGPFPPFSVTGLTTVIPSYLYQEYSDDDDLQGFVAAQNTKQQDYVDTFNALNLPIYTGPIVAGALLDWVASGLYGMTRPSLETGMTDMQGPLNTYGPNWQVPMWYVIGEQTNAPFGLNMIGVYGPEDVVVTNDDIYRRILTWHFYKGDGKYFNARWLKRRIWRFLYGIDGKSPESVDWWQNDNSIADTEQISVSYGINRSVVIRFVLGNRTVTGGAICNEFGPNGFQVLNATTPPWSGDVYLNDLKTKYVRLPPLPYMKEFQEALQSGVLEVPYQFNFTCQIG